MTFEGLDGSGKTTQIELLETWLRARGCDVVKTREPGGTPVSEKIRDVLLDISNKGMDERCEMLLYAAARAELVGAVIKPALQNGSVVICDRYVDSSFVYQGMGRGLGVSTVEQVNNAGTGGLLPDITFFLDIAPEVSLERRLSQSGSGDRIESEQRDFHDKVYEGYLSLAKAHPERIKRIDCAGSPEDIHKAIIRHMEALL